MSGPTPNGDGIPMTFLRTEARAGRVPFLRAGRRLLFDVLSVHQALVARAAGEPQGAAP